MIFRVEPRFSCIDSYKVAFSFSTKAFLSYSNKWALLA